MFSLRYGGALSIVTGPLVIYADGASRGNPGDSGIGVVIREPGGRVVTTLSESIGHATNNMAEYMALVRGLEEALLLQPSAVSVYVDSELVARQISGVYKVKNPHLHALVERVRRLCRQIPSVSIEHIPREKNREADKLARAGSRKAPAEIL